MKVFVVLSAILAIAAAAPGAHHDESSTFRKMVGNCLSSDETLTCLSVKAIAALNRAARSSNIEVLPGLSFARDPNSSARSGKSLSENEIVDSLPADSSERSGRLYDMAMDSLTSFIDTHSLELKFPKETTQEVARAIETGRGKLKKFAGPLLLALGTKLIALVPLFLGGLIFLAVKALVVSKIAFILAAVLGLQKLGAGSSGLNLLGKLGNGVQGWSQGSPSSAGWTSGTGGVAQQYPYARNYDNAQDLAYNAYNGEVPATQQS